VIPFIDIIAWWQQGRGSERERAGIVSSYRLGARGWNCVCLHPVSFAGVASGLAQPEHFVMTAVMKLDKRDVCQGSVRLLPLGREGKVSLEATRKCQAKPKTLFLLVFPVWYETG
jgi:hypothetical protein